MYVSLGVMFVGVCCYCVRESSSLLLVRLHDQSSSCDEVGGLLQVLVSESVREGVVATINVLVLLK